MYIMSKNVMLFVGSLFLGGGVAMAFIGGTFEFAVPASVLAIAGSILWAAVYMKD